MIQVDMGLAGPWIGGSAGWTLDEPAAAPDQCPLVDDIVAVLEAKASARAAGVRDAVAIVMAAAASM